MRVVESMQAIVGECFCMVPREGDLERKLAVILYADVAGYSRLTGIDEEGTHRILRDYLDLISASIENYNGQVVYYAGDAVLADFGTVVDALNCATEIQGDLNQSNRDRPEERRVLFRIGINLGDVIVDKGEIYGDGVNVAARSVRAYRVTSASLSSVHTHKSV